MYRVTVTDIYGKGWASHDYGIVNNKSVPILRGPVKGALSIATFLYNIRLPAITTEKGKTIAIQSFYSPEYGELDMRKFVQFIQQDEERLIGLYEPEELPWEQNSKE